MLDAGCRSVWPIQPHLRFLICVSIGVCFVLSHSCSFETTSGHLMLRMFLRHLLVNVCSLIPPSALDKASIMKRYHRRRTRSHTSPRSPTMVALHDTCFVECRWWNDGWTVKIVVTWRSSASMIPAPGSSRADRRHASVAVCDLRRYSRRPTSRFGCCVWFLQPYSRRPKSRFSYCISIFYDAVLEDLHHASFAMCVFSYGAVLGLVCWLVA